jgi:hypothetical protein
LVRMRGWPAPRKWAGPQEGSMSLGSRVRRRIVCALVVGISASVVANGAEPCPTPCSDAAITIAVVAPISGQPAATTFGGQVLKPIGLAVGQIGSTAGVVQGVTDSLISVSPKGLMCGRVNNHYQRPGAPYGRSG